MLRKKVAFIVHEYRPDVEGWSKEVELLQSHSTNSMIVDMGAKIGPMIGDNVVRVRGGPTSTAPALWLLRKYADMLHIFCFMSDRFIPRFMPRETGIATIIGPGNGMKPDSAHKRFRKIIVECERDRQLYVENGFDDSKLHIIRPGVFAAKSLARFGPTWKASQNRILVGSIPFGTSSFEERGVHLALETARILEGWEFFFFCRTSIVEKEIVDLAKSMKLTNIIAQRFIPENSQELYRDMTLTLFPFTSPMKNKSCPNMAIESIAHGVPIVATNHVGISKELNEWGVCVTSGIQPEEISNSIEQVASRDGDLQMRCVEVAHKHFGVARFLEKYERVYEEIAR